MKKITYFIKAAFYQTSKQEYKGFMKAQKIKMSGHKLPLLTQFLLEDTQSLLWVNTDHSVWEVHQVRGVPNHGLATFYIVILGERAGKHLRVHLITT